MNKIINYISNGKGIGAIIILLISTLFSLYISLVARTAVTNSIPYIQMIADEILPIDMVNGNIRVPGNTKKVYPIYSDDKLGDYSFTIDTTTDTIDTTNTASGLYLTRSYFYSIDHNNGEIKTTKLKGDLSLAKKNYTEVLKNNVKWLVIAIFIISLIAYFISYLLLNIFYAYCASIAEKLSKQNLNFDKKMRLSAVALSAVTLFSFVLSFANINLSWIVFIVLVICLQIILAKKLTPTPNANQQNETESITKKE